MKAPRVFRPSQSHITADIMARFLDHQAELADCIRALDPGDLGRVITSPANHWVVYSLGDACRIIRAHEALHFRQAKNSLELCHSKTGTGVTG